MSVGSLISSGPLKKITDMVFGKTPKIPVQKVVPPVEKILQSNIADETVRKQLGKMRKATMLSMANQAPANIKVNQLGAGV